jgi:hypothetical protein
MATTRSFSNMEFQEALATVRGTSTANVMSAAAMTAEDFDIGPTPEELNAIYSMGFRGVRPETTPVDAKKKWKELRAAMPGLYEIFPWAKGLGKNRINAPYLAAAHLIPGWGGLNAQVQGDCTVHSTEHAGEIDYCNDCVFGETKFKGQLAFENIYRSRGYNGDGWSCEAPAEYVGPEGRGGWLYRTVYNGPGGEKVDLTKYNSSWQSNGRSGVPAWLEEESRKNKCKWIIPIPDLDYLADAHAIGFGVSVCSGQGFASSTDEYGVASARGSWSHAMAHVASVTTEWAIKLYKAILSMIQNSWGKWNERSGKPEGAPDMTPGSMYVRGSTVQSMLNGDDSYALCGVFGWDREEGWELFDIGDYTEKLRKHLRGSTAQDYYEARAKWLREKTDEAYSSPEMFNLGSAL